VISIIRFKELEKWKNVGKWILVYGRRKTEKSYFLTSSPL
jgi:hypothetical protein